MPCDFEIDVSKLINKHSIENESGTPDYILARYVLSCLESFREATGEREAWFGRGIDGEKL